MIVRGMGQDVRKIIPLTIIPMTSSAFPEHKTEGKQMEAKKSPVFIIGSDFLPFVFRLT
jgi:hypothetical protein